MTRRNASNSKRFSISGCPGRADESARDDSLVGAPAAAPAADPRASPCGLPSLGVVTIARRRTIRSLKNTVRSRRQRTATERLSRASDRGLPSLVGCGGDLPVASRSVDLVTVSQLAHHLDDDSCRTLFRECHRVARLGVVVADLYPSRLAAVGFRIGGTLLGFDAVTIDDGVTSLRRGFTTGRLATLLDRAGITATVTRRPGARVVAWWRV